MSVHPIEYRYYSEEMKHIWDEETKLQAWLTVEAALAKAHAKLGNIPKEAAEEIAKKANTKYVKLGRVKAIEAEIHHDLMAMVKTLTEVCDKQAGKYVHYGATSYDIEDTALILQLRDAVNIIESDLIKLKNVLSNLAKKHKDTICVARTHGQQALPYLFALKFCIWAHDVYHHLQRLKQCKERALIGKMSGAVGTFASFGEKGFVIQDLVMKELNLKPAAITTQVVQREVHAELLFNLALIASTLEKIGKEIRNLQRTEIGEVEEPFREKQVGSSAMPQKRNPHKSERICGLARIMRSNILPALENVALEHERDLTNSAPERIIIPESFILIDYMLRQAIEILKGLNVYPEMMKKNLELAEGLIMSEAIMLELTKKGMNRQDAHELIRKCSIKAFERKRNFKEVLMEDKTVKKFLSREEIETCMKPENYIGLSKKIVDQVLKQIQSHSKD